MRNILWGLLAGLIVVTAGCGNKNTVTNSSLGVASVSFTSSADHLKVKETVAFTATARHADGSSASVTEWTSDAPGVASVDATGRVSGVSAGVATITASHDGMTATKSVHVVPDFDGNWQGRYSLSSCTATGDFQAANICAVLFDVDTTNQPIALTLTQTGDAVSGTMALEGVSGSVSGTFNDGGHITLSGNLQMEGMVATLSTSGTDMYADSGGNIAGTFAYDISATGYSGSVHIVFTITSMNKGAAFTMPSAVSWLRTLSSRRR